MASHKFKNDNFTFNNLNLQNQASNPVYKFNIKINNDQLKEDLDELNESLFDIKLASHKAETLNNGTSPLEINKETLNKLSENIHNNTDEVIEQFENSGFNEASDNFFTHPCLTNLYKLITSCIDAILVTMIANDNCDQLHESGNTNDILNSILIDDDFNVSEL